MCEVSMLELTDFDEVAQDLNGTCTWDFNQNVQFFRISAIALGSCGICLSLSSEWIRRFLHGDSLANHLGGVMKGRIWIGPNLGELTRICVLQNAIERAGAGWKSKFLKDMWDKHWIRYLGVNTYKADHVGVKTGLKKVSGACGLVTILSSDKHNDGSHTIAVYVGKQGEPSVIFDPNFGEYWFNEREELFFFVFSLIEYHYRVHHRFDMMQVDKFSKTTLSTKFRAMLSRSLVS